MALNANAEELFTGFSKLSREQRFQRLQEMGALNSEDVTSLKKPQLLNPELADKFIENVIGYFQLPMGVATNFNIDGKDYVIPMAVEETSIIAALCKTAKWIRKQGNIKTWITGSGILGQIQIAKVKNYAHLQSQIERNKPYLIELANENVAASMVKRGGGVKDIYLRRIARDDGEDMAIIHVLVETCDAMGANTIIQICEFLKNPVEHLSNETVTMCILSNLNDSKITHAEVTINHVDAELGNKLQEASLFAEHDPYRAATHNKGVLNGVDPILIATGNDWRAVEAGIHAYAAREGKYGAITTWRYDQNNKKLVGNFAAPITVGTVGGVTRLHPTAQLALRMLDVKSADELSRVIAAVGLSQNLGALRALITLGFTEGHMKLHITNLSMSAGANAEEIPQLKSRLEELLALSKRITLSNAKEILQELRTNNKAKEIKEIDVVT